MKVIVGISGASGAPYAVALLERLREAGVKTGLVISEQGKLLLKFETGLALKDVRKKADAWYDNDDLAAPISSGSQRFDALVIVPCSMSTLSKIACGIADNLMTRAASVCLKERRRLVLVPRETPFSAIHLENMHRLALLGATVLPAMPGFYHEPKAIEDLVNFVVGKIMEQLGLEHGLYEKWKADDAD